MSNTVSSFSQLSGTRWPSSGTSLYAVRGARKYLTRAERGRLLATLMERRSDSDLFALTLAWTGARITEILSLTRENFQIEASVVALVTLKRRRPVVREVPIPAELMALLEARYDLSGRAEDGPGSGRLWPFCRATGWRYVKAAMAEAGLSGRAACPRGMRHGFGVGTLQSGVPLSLVQRWLGHARMTTTAIYVEVSGPEEASFAAGYWHWSKVAGV